MFITKRKLNKKLELLLHRQNLLATVVFATSLNDRVRGKMTDEWNKLWFKIMEGEDGERK